MATKIQDIAIGKIEVGARLRATDPAAVEVIKQSIQDNETPNDTGLLMPPIVRPIRRVGKGPFELLAGAHRLKACEEMGWKFISCQVRKVDDDQAELIQVDENLMGPRLNVLDRAVFLSARKDLHVRMGLATRPGGDRKSAEFKDQDQKANIALWSFAEETAEKMDLSVRTINTAIKLLKGLRPETRARLAGTWLADHQAALIQISKLRMEEQSGVLDRMLRAQNPMGRVSDALADYEGRALGRERTPSERLMASLIHNWNRAGVKVRRDFIRLIKETNVGEIEFDPEGYGEAP